MPMDALQEFLKRGPVSEDTLSSPKVKKLKKAIKNIEAVRKIADQHTGDVAQEIGTLAALALIELGELLAARSKAKPSDASQRQRCPEAAQDVQIHEPEVRLKT
ncbi:hypothetical protein [Chromobacterium amazonense]|uniref:hypothetical protein n=1 Tax=Chromobacterium amazonense TaxID=1382803 RepID=UPI003F79DB66